MTREKEIDVAATHYDNGYYEDSKLSAYCCFRDGAKWADNNPKSPWISVEDDLPCNHDELIETFCGKVQETVYVIVYYEEDGYDIDYMENNPILGWIWNKCKPLYWMSIPQIPNK